MRDYPAVYPFDSECDCPSPFPSAVVEELLPAANEVWFREHQDDLGIITEPAAAQGRPRLTVVQKAPAAERPGHRPQGTRPDGLLAGNPPAEPKTWAGVRVG